MPDLSCVVALSHSSLTTLYGIVASPARICEWYLTGAWSCNWLAVAASPLLPVTTNEASYNTKTCIPLGSMLVHLLVNIYTSELLVTVSRKYAYASSFERVVETTAWLH